MAVLGLALVAAPPSGQAAAAAGVISTVAGGSGGPGLATHVDVTTPCGLSFGGGRLYIADYFAVRRVNPATDRLTTPAGAANAALGDGGPAALAGMGACGAAPDHQGNLLIADGFNGRIRVVPAGAGTYYGRAMAKGDIYTVAGGGTAGLGDGGPATRAELGPTGVTVDSAGNLVIADSGHNRIRVVAEKTGTFYGQAMAKGDIYTVAGGGTAGLGDGGPATAAELNVPLKVALDGAGNLVIADSGHNRIRVVAGRTATFYGQPMTAHHIYTVAGGGTAGLGDGGPATAAELNDPNGVAVDAAGNLAIADTFDQRIRVVAARSGTFYGTAMTKGDIYTVTGNGTPGYSGDGGPAAGAELGYPEDVTVDGDGNLVIADTANSRIRAVAAASGTFYAVTMTAGDIYTVASNGHSGNQDGEPGYSGDGGPALRAELAPSAIVVDSAGNLVMADSSRIRVVAASTGTFYGKPMTAGYIFDVAGDGNGAYSGDGGPAASAGMSPDGVALDGHGNLVIADTGNNRIRVVAEKTGTFYGHAMTAGDIYTVAGNGHQGFYGDGGRAIKANLHRPAGVAIDATGNLVIADTGNNRVRVVAEKTGTFYGTAMTKDDIYTVSLSDAPVSVAADHAGNLVVAATGNDSLIQVVAGSTGTFYQQHMTAGGTYTMAGIPGCGYSGDGGPAIAALLCEPSGVAVDGHGNILIADSDNSRIRVVAEHTGTFYSQAMTTGDIYTVAGNGNQMYSGDGGPATAAALDLPGSVAAYGAGSLVIADSNNHRVREVTG